MQSTLNVKPLCQRSVCKIKLEWKLWELQAAAERNIIICSQFILTESETTEISYYHPQTHTHIFISSMWMHLLSYTQVCTVVVRTYVDINILLTKRQHLFGLLISGCFTILITLSSEQQEKLCDTKLWHQGNGETQMAEWR